MTELNQSKAASFKAASTKSFVSETKGTPDSDKAADFRRIQYMLDLLVAGWRRKKTVLMDGVLQWLIVPEDDHDSRWPNMLQLFHAEHPNVILQQIGHDGFWLWAGWEVAYNADLRQLKEQREFAEIVTKLAFRNWTVSSKLCDVETGVLRLQPPLNICTTYPDWADTINKKQTDEYLIAVPVGSQHRVFAIKSWFLEATRAYLNAVK